MENKSEVFNSLIGVLRYNLRSSSRRQLNDEDEDEMAQYDEDEEEDFHSDEDDYPGSDDDEPDSQDSQVWFSCQLFPACSCGCVQVMIGCMFS